MNKFYSNKYQHDVIMLRAGEYVVSRHGEILYTILGSCIATCIYDTEKCIGGMNHFMLPGTLLPEEILTSDIGRYGMFAMELLIGELIKAGARRENLTAKIFGGGNVLQFRTQDGDVTGSNIRFAQKYLELEGIPTLSKDLGGDCGRKVLFFSDSARALVKRFDIEKEKEIIDEENKYKSMIFRNRRTAPSAIFF